MPVFSLPSKYGIGSFGKEAYRFVDFLVEKNTNKFNTKFTLIGGGIEYIFLR